MRFRQIFLLFLFCTVPAVQATGKGGGRGRRESSRRPSNRNSKALVGPIRNQSPRPSTPEQVDVPPAVPDAPTLEEHDREWRGGHSRADGRNPPQNVPPAVPDAPSLEEHHREWRGGGHSRADGRNPPQTSGNYGQQPFYDPPRGRRQSNAAYGPPPPGYDRGRSRTRGPEQERSKYRSPSIDSDDEERGRSSRADRQRYPPSTFDNPGRGSAYGPPPARGQRQSDAARGRSRTRDPEHRSSSIPYGEEMGRSSRADRQRYPPSTFDNPGRGSAYGPPPSRGRRQSDAAYGPPPPDRGRSTTRPPDDATNGYTRSPSKIRLRPGNGSYSAGDDRMGAGSHVRPTVVDQDEDGNPIYGKSGQGPSSPTSPTSPTSDYRRGSVKVPLPPQTDEYRRPGSSGSGLTGDLPFRSQPNSPPSSRHGVRWTGMNAKKGDYGPGYGKTW